MNADQIRAVRSTFAQIAPRGDAVAAHFYATLFDHWPELRALFRGPLDAQGRKLMQVLGLAVAQLERLPELAPTLRALGRRHADIGVVHRHYEWVGQALVGTLQNELAGAFTPAAHSAWIQAYAALAGTMLKGAQQYA